MKQRNFAGSFFTICREAWPARIREKNFVINALCGILPGATCRERSIDLQGGQSEPEFVGEIEQVPPRIAITSTVET